MQFLFDLCVSRTTARLLILTVFVLVMMKSSSTYKRQPSGTSTRKSSQPKDLSGSRGSKTMARSRGQRSQDQVQADEHREVTAFGVSSSIGAIDRRNAFDSARISQWAAQSATGPSTFYDYGTQDSSNPSYCNDVVPSSASPQVPIDFSAPSDNFLDPVHAAPLPLEYNSDFTYCGPNTSSVGNAFESLEIGQGSSQDHLSAYPSTFDGEAFCNGSSSNMNSYAYPAFLAGDSLPLNPIDAHPPMVLGNDVGLTISPSWEVPQMDVTQVLDWSPASDITPSSSSMQSSNSFLGQSVTTPISRSMYDGVFYSRPDTQGEGDNGVMPSFNLGEPIPVDPSSLIYQDPERLAHFLKYIFAAHI